MNIRLRQIFLALALASVGSWAFAQQTASSNWVPLGLEYEKVTTLVLDERVPGTLLPGSESDFSAGSHGGVFRSSNEGATWDTLLRGYSILSIVTHPVSSDTIFVCTGPANYSTSGILKSTERGETWAWWDQGISLNSETSVGSMAIDPSSPSVMYAGTGGAFGGSLYKSIDAGRSWGFLNPPDEIGFGRILVQPDAGNNLLVATTGHGRVLRSTDAGESWSVQLDSTDQVLTLESTMAGRIVCAGFGRYSHYKYGRSIDFGVTWSDFSMVDSVNRGVYSLALSSTDPDIVFTVTAGPNNHVYRSSDGGKVWEPLPKPAQLPRVVRYAPLSDNLYLGCNRIDSVLGGVFKLDFATGVDHSDNSTHQPSFHTYPNPFNSDVKMRIVLSERSSVLLEIFNVLGEIVWRSDSGLLEAGTHDWTWSATGRPTGAYFCRAKIGSTTLSNKMILNK